jgi:hypothetical protein
MEFKRNIDRRPLAKSMNELETNPGVLGNRRILGP